VQRRALTYPIRSVRFSLRLHSSCLLSSCQAVRFASVAQRCATAGSQGAVAFVSASAPATSSSPAPAPKASSSKESSSSSRARAPMARRTAQRACGFDWAASGHFRGLESRESKETERRNSFTCARARAYGGGGARRWRYAARAVRSLTRHPIRRWSPSSAAFRHPVVPATHLARASQLRGRSVSRRGGATKRTRLHNLNLCCAQPAARGVCAHGGRRRARGGGSGEGRHSWARGRRM